VDAELGRILGFQRLTPLLASAGQPDAAGIAAIARAGFRHLINLALPSSPGALADEAVLAQAAGLEYLHLPIDFEQPEQEPAARLFSALERWRDEPVFVHCAKNMRVSALLSVQRMMFGGVSCAAARAELHAIWQPNHTWRRYLSNVALRALPHPVRIETPRLVLRDAELSDADAIHRYASDAEVCRYMIWGPNTLERTREALQYRVNEQQADPQRRAFELQIVEKSSNELVGGVGIRVADSAALDADLGYVLVRSRWGQGIVLEACQRLLEVGFGWFNLHRIWASTDAQNLASQRVLEKLGMRREAHFIQNELIKGAYRDSLIYAITATEYWSQSAKASPTVR
jgi:ribosomal-protein-alanine N-acetyltransferase